MSTNNNVKALKSGVWYTFSNLVTKSIGFLTTPIFTRLLSRNDYGLYSNYSSWLQTFTVFATLNLGASFISARYDYENGFDGYVSSTLVLSSIVTGIWAILINIFSGFFSSLMGVDIQYINVMIIYLLLFSAVDMFQMRERYYFKYKTTVATSLIIAIMTALLSVLLVVNLENKLFGRIIGSAVPTIFVGALLYILLIKRGKKVNFKYWGYALPLCVPYIPHVLSLSLLNSMDKMMITRICGAEENALYSVAYSCGAIVTMLVSSLNNAFAPWLGEKLHFQEYGEIRRVSRSYIMIFTFLVCGIMLVSPELLLFMGGKSYSEAIFVMPPVALGCVCQFLYTMYVNIEQFSKKTVGMAIASVMAALSNFILNMIFIPIFGYIAAAYTTLASFLILLLIHMWLVRKMDLLKVYSYKLMFGVIGALGVYTVLIHFLYMNSMVRYAVFAVYIIVAAVLFFRYKDMMLRIIKRKRK